MTRYWIIKGRHLWMQYAPVKYCIFLSSKYPELVVVSGILKLSLARMTPWKNALCDLNDKVKLAETRSEWWLKLSNAWRIMGEWPMHFVLARTGVRSHRCCIGSAWRLKGVQGGQTAVWNELIVFEVGARKEYFESVKLGRKYMSH